MSTSPIEFAYCQIEHLLSGLNKKNYRQSLTELNNLISTFKFKAEIHTLRYLFSAIYPGINEKQQSKENYLINILLQEYNKVIVKPNFLTYIAHSLDNPINDHEKNLCNEGQLEDLFTALKFNNVQSFTFAMIAKTCYNQNIKRKCITYITDQLAEFLNEMESADSKKNDVINFDQFISNLSSNSSIELLHFILTGLLQDNLTQIQSTSKVMSYMLQSFRKIYPKQRVPCILLNILYPETVNQPIIHALTPNGLIPTFESLGDIHMLDYDGGEYHPKAWTLAKLLAEFGWVSTKSVKNVHLVLNQVSMEDITPRSVAKCICMFLRPLEKTNSQEYTEESLRSSFQKSVNSIEKELSDSSSEENEDYSKASVANKDWNLKNFFKGINKVTEEKFYWHEVIQELDCNDFNVYDSRSFSMIKVFLKICFDSDEEIVKDFFYHPWRNALGQFSLLKYCLMNPAISPLNHFPYREVDLKEICINPNEKILTSNLWENIDYVEAMLTISKNGLYKEVYDLLYKGLNISPDIMTMTLLSIETSSVCRDNLLREGFINFFHNRPNSQKILKLAWSKSDLQPLLLSSCLQFINDLTTQQKKKQMITIINVETTPTLSGFIEILATLPNVKKKESCYKVKTSTGTLPYGILHTILGTPDGSSSAVATLLPANSINVDDNLSVDVDMLNNLKPSISLAIDLALILLIQMTNAISAIHGKSTNGDAISQETVTSMHKNIKSFLSSWFKEQLSYEKNADLFANTIVKYLKTRYPNISSKPEKITSAIANDNLYPMDLRSPSHYLIKHIIEAAISAINSEESKVSQAIVTSTNKILTGLLLSLQSVASSSNQKVYNPSGGQLSNVGNLALSTSDHNTRVNQSRAILSGSGKLNSSMLSRNQQQQQIMPTSLLLEPGQAHHDLPMPLTFDNEPFKTETPKDIEQEVDKFFVLLLEGKEMVQTVFEYATRGSPFERRILEGILPMLAEEVSQHLPEYPDIMLPYICQLYGNILASGIKILSRRGLSMMWRALLNRFYQLPTDISTDQPIFKELLQILIKAKNSFTQMYNLPNCFINCPIFRNFPTDLQNWINNAEYMGKSYYQHSKSSISPVNNMVPESPDEKVTNRISFLFNNLTNTNLKEKCDELSNLLEDSSIAWFSYYLVTKRVVSETNYHEVFSNILNHLQEKHPKLRPKVINELIRNIKIIFANIRVDKDDLPARRSLQNLGQFLGYITLLVNKPILHDDLNMKDLVYEAYYKGSIFVQYVIPFVSRIIKSAAKSVVFKPPNPWTMGLLKVLREYYDMREVVAKLKFEIEILFKEFSLGIDDVSMTYFLRDSSYGNHLEVHLCAYVSDKNNVSDFQSDSHQMSQQNTQGMMMRQSSQVPNLQTSQMPAILSPIPSSSQNAITPTTPSLINSPAQVPFNNMGRQVSMHHMSNMNSRGSYPFSMVNPPNQIDLVGNMNNPASQISAQSSNSFRYKDVDLSIVLASANLEEIIQHAITTGSKSPMITTMMILLEAKPELRPNIQSVVESTIADLVPFVFERCTRITVMTASSIVKKDFALDPDPNRIRIAGCLMVRHLASSISLVTARDVLNQNLLQHVKQTIITTALGGNSETDKETVEFITQQIVSKCMPTCLAYIQKTVAELVVKEMERALESEMRTRTEFGKVRYLERARLQIAQQQSNLPEILKIPKTLSHADMMVYEDFRRFIPGFSAGSSVSTLVTTPTPSIPQAPIGQVHTQMKVIMPHVSSTSAIPVSSNQNIRPQISASNSAGYATVQGQNNSAPTIVTSGNPYSSQVSAVNVYDTSITQVERHISVINTFATNNGQTNHPTLKDALENLRSLAEFLTLSKHQSASQNPPPISSASGQTTNQQSNQTTIINNCNTLILMLIKSLIKYYRSSLWKDIPQGLEILEIFKEAYMVILSHLPVPYTWVTRQVTNAWIELANEVDDASKTDEKSVTNKWNWEAFSELLKVHVIYLSVVDHFLAEKVSQKFEPAISFILDLLDNLVLPQPIQNVPEKVPENEQQNENAPKQANNTKSHSKSGSKRKFTVLNEFDLWCTLEALRKEVNRINSVSTSPITTRMKVTCARVRAILDLGLMESNPLFAVTGQSEYHPIAPPAVSALYAGCSQARQFDDTKSLHENTEIVIQTWFDICSQQITSRTVQAAEQLLGRLSSFFTTEQQMTGFFRIATVFVIEKAQTQLRFNEQPKNNYQMLPNNVTQPSNVRNGVYQELDAFAKLMALIIKRSGRTFDDFETKVLVLNKALGIIAGTLLHEYEVLRNYLHPMPFERILIMLFNELYSPALSLDPNINTFDEKLVLFNPKSLRFNESNENGNGNSENNKTRNFSGGSSFNISFRQQIPLSFAHVLHLLRPDKATIFVFSWLEILAHRCFVGKTLATNPNTTPTPLRLTYRAMYAQLMVDLLKFLGFFVQNAVMPKPIQCLYKATLRLLVVLTKDFPEFVSDYYALFCDVVPTNSIQMRNLILVAPTKRGMVMEDFLQTPTNDLLTRLEDPSGYCMSAGSRLPTSIRQIVDSYLANRQPQSLLMDLVSAMKKTDDFSIMLPNNEPASVGEKTNEASEASTSQSQPVQSQPVQTPNEKLSKKKKKELAQQSNNAAHQQAIEAAAVAAISSMDLSIGSISSQATSTPAGENCETRNSAKNTDNNCDLDSQPAVNQTVPNEETLYNLQDGLWNSRSVQQLATFGVVDEMHYNVQLMTNLVLYIGITAISHLRSKSINLEMESIQHTPQMDIIDCLVNNLDNEGRYLLLNCMANQLRYPNSHTYYFSFVILHLFAQNSQEAVKEQISRVLMERLIVNHPHPWGLLMTSAELLRNPIFGFWEHDFARCNSEIEAIVTIVASSCIPNFKIPATKNSTASVLNVNANQIPNSVASAESHSP